MPGAENKFEGNDCWMITLPSRGRFYLYRDNPEDIKIGDIANATSKQCRFSGHMALNKWYSVAEHQVDTSRIVELLGGSTLEQFVALMHDSPEFALSDICAPFKREIGQYYEKEALIWARMVDKFGLPKSMPTIVKRADWIALFMEAMTFVVPNHRNLLRDFVGWKEYGRFAEVMYGEWIPLWWQFWRRRHIMHGYSYGKARKVYLARYEELTHALVREYATSPAISP